MIQLLRQSACNIASSKQKRQRCRRRAYLCNRRGITSLVAGVKSTEEGETPALCVAQHPTTTYHLNWLSNPTTPHNSAFASKRPQDHQTPRSFTNRGLSPGKNQRGLYQQKASPMPTLTLPPLRDIHNLLHLTFHRNKNQHRIAKWWKALAVLRRQIGRLIAEVEDATTGKKGSHARVALRCQFLNERIVPDCFLSFSRVVADNQYSALGLMLLGTLASLQRLLVPFRQKLIKEETVVPELSKVVPNEDVGVTIVRKRGAEEEVETKRARSKAERTKEKDKTSKATTTKKKKKKKKGDAIDDLFSGLL